MYAQVTKFQKNFGNATWGITFDDQISRINAYQIDSTNDLYVCGDYQPNEATDVTTVDSSVEYRAVVSKIAIDSGAVSWIVEMTGSNPLYNGSTIKN